MTGRIIKSWPLVVAIVTLVYTVGKTTNTINALEEDQAVNERVDAEQDRRITKVEESEANLEKRLDRIENKLDKILQAVR